MGGDHDGTEGGGVMTTAIDLALKLSSDHLLQRLHEVFDAWGHRLATLAVVSGIDAASLKRKMAGRASFTMDELTAVCRVMEVSVAELLAPEPNMRMGTQPIEDDVIDAEIVDEATPGPCPVYSWCTVGDGPSHVEDGFHSEDGVTERAPGYLRTDHVLFDGQVTLGITESFDWQIAAPDSREFFRTLRASIDVAEEKFEEFKAQVSNGEAAHA